MYLTSESGKKISIKKPSRFVIDWQKNSRSKFQHAVKSFLYPYWKRDVVFEEFPVPHTRLSLDFFNISKNVAIEVQGSQHIHYNKFFHGNTRYKYLTQLKRDQQKLDFCDSFGILLVEIYSEDELNKDFFNKAGVIL